MVPVPENAKKVTDKIVAYTHEHGGKKYVDIRKTYIDPVSGEPAIGKGGLSVTVEDWMKILDFRVY